MVRPNPRPQSSGSISAPSSFSHTMSGSLSSLPRRRGGGNVIGMYHNGNGIAGKDVRGATITDDHFLLYFNADGPAQVTLPTEEYAAAWDVVIDTSGNADAEPVLEAGGTFDLGTHSLVVLREHSEPEASPDHSVAASLAARTGTDVS